MERGRLKGIGAWGLASALAVLAAGPAVQAQRAKAPAAPSEAAEGRTAGYNTDRNAYFGDLHVHTKLSFDAYIFNVRTTPDDAYVFAKGGTIGHAAGFDIRLAGGPLDFVAVTDHSEYLGALREVEDPQSAIAKLPILQGIASGNPADLSAAFNRVVAASRTNSLPLEMSDPAVAGKAWREIQDAAARHNEPGRFTTFIGYEFTSAPDGQNLHRNVIFRGAGVPGLPYSARDAGNNPENLWRTMDGWRGGRIEAMAIPHNSNGSDGRMFQDAQYEGKPMDRVYAELRMRNEPLVEISQVKGTSETHPSLSPNDEWANFEIMESYIGTAKPVTKFAGSYARTALLDGLGMQESKGFNPYKFGFISSTDTHNSAPGSSEESNYFSKVGRVDGLPAQRGSTPKEGKMWTEAQQAAADATGRYQTWGASGLAGVWAEENTREAVYAALRRKETFATSGPRIRVRFFASYDYPADLATRGDLVKQAYARGVPMGGDLLPSRGKAPTFLVWGIRDPQSGFLQRAQVVKGWIENGQSKERVFDVACSDGAKPSAAGRCPDNGATVDLATCAVSRFKGDVELRTTWTDPTFNPKQRAFYYLRVLENPSCRWSTWDAIRNGSAPNPKLAKTIQERAWSSPIWYEPAA